MIHISLVYHWEKIAHARVKCFASLFFSCGSKVVVIVPSVWVYKEYMEGRTIQRIFGDRTDMMRKEIKIKRN